MNPLERITWLRPVAVPGVELCAIVNCTSNPSLFHTRYAVCAVTSVVATGRYRRQTLLMDPGSLSLFEPGESHSTTRIHQPGDAQIAFFAPDLVERVAWGSGLPGPVHFRLQREAHHDPLLFTAIQQLAASASWGGTPLAQQSWQTLCLQHLLTFTERWQPLRQGCGSANRAQVKRAMAFLQERFQEPVELGDLVALTGMSPYILIRNFTAMVGMPPHAYQIHVRVERARAMLARGAHPGLVATATGFADQSHLIRLFKRVMGVTPGAYQRLGDPRALHFHGEPTG
jgi:AraC-like DNA-binding protein